MGCNARVIAIDIPSRLDCDLGKPLGIAIKASHTITIIGLKQGFVEDSTLKYVGNVTVVHMGCPQALLKKYALSNS
jgi:NAD(P)H-hydrate repair Nnr-like enzyme with NAD(P)H-hydrate epimerase domain